MQAGSKNPEMPTDRFPWEQKVMASINIQLVRIKLVRLVDRKHGTGIEHIVPATTTYPAPWHK
jgi:hypothetical protein